MAASEKRRWTRWLTIADHVTLAVIIAPLTVMFWWATWNLIDYYLYPNYKLGRGAITCLVGWNGMLLCYCLQDPWTYFSRKYDSCGTWIILNHIYTAFFGFSNVCHWHGIWSLTDILIDILIGYWGDQLTWSAIFLSATISILCLMRQLTNVRAPPIIVSVDVDPQVYKISTRFNRSWQKHGTWYILDCAFTSCIVHSFVVLFWRNSWVIWDLKMAHFELATDGAICLVVAYILTTIVYLMQVPVSKMIKDIGKIKEQRILCVLTEQFLMHLWAGEAAVALWRGCWLSYSSFIKIPNHPAGGFWLGCFTGMGSLMFMMAATSILARGGDVDGASVVGRGAILSTKYIRYFYEKKLKNRKEKGDLKEMEVFSSKESNGKVDDIDNGHLISKISIV